MPKLRFWCVGWPRRQPPKGSARGSKPRLGHVLSSTPLSNERAQEARLTIKDKNIAARSNGSLQIEVHDPLTNDRMFCSRMYYIVPLEVHPLSLPAPQLIPGKTFLSRNRKRHPKNHQGNHRAPHFRRPNFRRNVSWDMSPRILRVLESGGATPPTSTL